MIFGVNLEKSFNHLGLGKCSAINFLNENSAKEWEKEATGYNVEREIFSTEEEVLEFLGKRGFPKKFATKVLHFAEVNEN